MRWVLFALAAAAGIVVVAALIGAMLPQAHHASRKARFQASPDKIYALVAGPPEIYTLIFRTVARFFIGYTSTIDGYLRDLAAKLNQQIQIQN